MTQVSGRAEVLDGVHTARGGLFPVGRFLASVDIKDAYLRVLIFPPPALSAVCGELPCSISGFTVWPVYSPQSGHQGLGSRSGPPVDPRFSSYRVSGRLGEQLISLLKSNRFYMVHTLKKFGWVLNFQESALLPAQSLQYPGRKNAFL